MVYSHEHILLRFHGHFGTSGAFTDEWSCGMRFGFPNLAPVFDTGKLQTFVNAAQTAGNTFQASAGAQVGTNCFLDYVSGAQIGVSGRYTPSTQLTIISPTTTTAGAGSSTLPWNTSNVISLRTNIPRGRGSNGRVYWPMLATTIVSTTGRLAAGTVNNRIGAAKTFLDALNVAANNYSAGMKLLVASSVGGGTMGVVQSIRADDRMDSIERRENDQASVYQQTNLA